MKKVTDVLAGNASLPPAKPKPRLKNHVYFVLDDSASMRKHKDAAERLFFNQAKNLREVSEQLDQDATISLLTFGADVYPARLLAEPVKTVRLPSTGFLTAGGHATALLLATKTAMTDLLGLRDIDDPNTSVLLQIITDGENNRHYELAPEVKNLIAQVERTDRWTVVYSVPDARSAQELSRQFGVHPGNITVWDTNSATALRDLDVKTTAATSDFLRGRAAGKRSTKGFYTPDLAGVSVRDLKRNLMNLADQFKAFNIREDENIKEFVERRVRRTYEAGKGYYQLIVPVKVQASKSFLIREKGKDDAPIYGGGDARDLLGFPDTGTISVRPDANVKYDVFIQSRSPFRKLLKGQTFLYQTK